MLRKLDFVSFLLKLSISTPPSAANKEREIPEAFIFDKAEAMEQLESLREKRDILAEEMYGLSAKLKTSGAESERMTQYCKLHSLQ